MANLPELPESIKRQLELEWSSLLDKHRLTGEDLQLYDQQRDRFLATVERRRRHGLSSDEAAADKYGIEPTVALAETWFRNLCVEYWRLWSPSEDGYEGFTGWLDILRGQVSTEVASVWKGKSTAIDSWYQRACGPAVGGHLQG